MFDNVGGIRCFWDGGLSSGMATEQIPWASILKTKGKKWKERIRTFATGRWSKYGNPILAPESFSKNIPPFSCEAFLHHEDFYRCRQMTTSDHETEDFNELSFIAFSAAPIGDFTRTGLVSTSNTYIDFDQEEIKKWLIKHLDDKISFLTKGTDFEAKMFAILSWEGWTRNAYVMKHIILPNEPIDCKVQMSVELQKIIDKGGKGAYFRNPMSAWTPCKTDNFLRFDL